MVESSPPSSVSELQSFIGSVNYFRKFIPNLASLLSPLYRLLKKNVPWQWTKTEDDAFRKLKDALCSTEVLAYYSPDQPLVLQTDASGVGLGAVLLQRNGNGDLLPVADASRTLTKAECNYSNIERESLALVFGTSRFRQYLLSRSFTLETDHHPLVKLFGMREGVPCLVSTRLKKWKLNLAAYDYTIRYIPGKRNVMADFMSRNPISSPAGQAETIDDAQVLFIEEELIDAQTIIAETKKDPVLSKVLQFTVNGWAEKVDDSLLQPYFSKRWELSVSNDVLFWNDRVVIPTSLRLPLLHELHAEHSGSVRMNRVARRYFWWPKMDDEIEQTTQHCANCQEQARRPTKSYATWTWPSGPWRRIHVDFAGPFLGKMFLIVVDAYSKYLDVIPMATATSAGTISISKCDFPAMSSSAAIMTSMLCCLHQQV